MSETGRVPPVSRLSSIVVSVVTGREPSNLPSCLPYVLGLPPCTPGSDDRVSDCVPPISADTYRCSLTVKGKWYLGTKTIDSPDAIEETIVGGRWKSLLLDVFVCYYFYYCYVNVVVR